uniref:ATP receptor n=1 Tax=Schistocephalus solidus TaxID=70667 RepID=A0A183STG3_SCHSO
LTKAKRRQHKRPRRDVIMGWWNELTSSMFDYETQKVVQINSKKIGCTFRLIQLGIILYVIIWVMIYEKGYQSFDEAVSGVTAKLKGVAFANLTNNSNIGAMVWDAADYVIPPQQRSAFFVMTNLVITPGQTLGACEEAHDVYGNDCQSDADCQAGNIVMLGSGVQTGNCVKRRNILSWMDKKFLFTCRYNPYDEKMKYCPIFSLGDIMNYTDAENKEIWRQGGMVSIHIEWNCNLDFDEEQCLPKYVFRRLDDFDSIVGKGWNFRYSYHYMENGTRMRNLIKAYGIQFFITVYGKGGKFNMLTFSMNLGSGLALLGIATVLCDMIVLNVTRKRNLYRDAKVDLVAQQKKLVKKRYLQFAESQCDQKHRGSEEGMNSECRSRDDCEACFVVGSSASGE